MGCLVIPPWVRIPPPSPGWLPVNGQHAANRLDFDLLFYHTTWSLSTNQSYFGGLGEFCTSLPCSLNLLLKLILGVRMTSDTPPQCLLAGVPSGAQSGAEPFLKLLGKWSPG